MNNYLMAMLLLSSTAFAMENTLADEETVSIKCSDGKMVDFPLERFCKLSPETNQILNQIISSHDPQLPFSSRYGELLINDLPYLENRDFYLRERETLLLRDCLALLTTTFFLKIPFAYEETIIQVAKLLLSEESLEELCADPQTAKNFAELNVVPQSIIADIATCMSKLLSEGFYQIAQPMQGKIIAIKDDMVLTSPKDEQIILIDRRSGEILLTVTVDPVHAFSNEAYFSHSGNYFIVQLLEKENTETSYKNCGVMVIDKENGTYKILHEPDGCLCIFDANLNSLITRGWDKYKWYKWDLNTDQKNEISLDSYSVCKTHLSNDGKKVAAIVSVPGFVGGNFIGNAANACVCYDIDTETTQQVSVANACSNACFTPENHLFVLNNNNAQLWNLEGIFKKKDSRVVEEQDSLGAIFNNVFTQAFALVRAKQYLNIWNTRKANRRQVQMHKPIAINNALKISESGDTAAIGLGGDLPSEWCIIDTLTGQEIVQCGGMVHGFDANENIYVVDDGSIKLYDHRLLRIKQALAKDKSVPLYMQQAKVQDAPLERVRQIGLNVLHAIGSVLRK